MADGEPRVVVIADPISAAALRALSAGPCEVLDASADPGKLEVSLPRAWGLIVRSRTKVSASFLDRAPKLKFVARAGVGVDNIDVEAATARGISVVNAPTAATTSVAELTLALLLTLARGLAPKVADTKAGGWNRSGLGVELSGKTVGFVGYGRIAREVARLLGPFRTPTIAYDPFVGPGGDATEILPLDEVLARSDFLSLHAALTPENHHLINAERIARMRRGAFLVNVARGALVDEGALLEGLEAGRIGGAALDVFEEEPPKRLELLRHPRVVATPHLGASTEEAQTRAGMQVVDETLRALAGKPLEGLVNRPGARA